MKLLVAPLTVSIVVLAAVFFWGGSGALFIAFALAVLEVTLSFDNAVINARVLEKMSARWQRRFLTWGVLVSVGIVRFVLPVLIVSTIVALSPIQIAALAFAEPAKYAALVATAEPAIKAFGGTFLLLVSLRYFFNKEKEVHWIATIERRLARWGEVEAIGIAFALIALFMVATLSSAPHALILESGLIGTVLFIAMESITRALGVEARAAARSSFALFVYLDVLDTAFSLDSVVGAFAITTSVPVIVAGLGIGAFFVRSLTLMLVRGGTLKKLLYIEHGAYWAIFALALCMFGALIVPIPEWFVASVGLLLVLFAYLSSRRVLAYEPEVIR
ncbi:MAG TPA: DUF475 domain-containing protein [Candidatus Paceibacterota bacterium]